MAMSEKIEEKLFQNRYRVDEGAPHIRVDAEKVPSEQLKAMVNICPAGCYQNGEDGKVEVVADGCMECGTCRIVCQETGEVTWQYPRGGYGVLFKFG
jgi:ferredoxin like protein